MTHREGREPTEPDLELEVSPLDEAEQSAIAELEELREERPKRSYGFLDQLGPSMRPDVAPATEKRGVHGLPEPARRAATQPTENIGAIRLSDAGPRSDPRSASGGLISSILGQLTGATGDDGALAALRTLPRRARPDVRSRSGLGEPELTRERMDLVLQLADSSRGAVRARLLTAAAELMTHRGEPERAFATHVAAWEADPSDRVALRRLRRAQLSRGQYSQAATLFRSEAKLSPHAREQSLALAAAAELDAVVAAAESPTAPAAISGDAEQAASAADPSSLLASLLLAQRALSSGRLSEAAAALRGSAESAGARHAATLLWLEAGRAFEHGANHASAKACFEKARALDAGSLAAQLGLVRVCTKTRDESGRVSALAALHALNEHGGDAHLAAEFARQHGLLLCDVRDDAKAALEILRTQDTPRGLRTLARAAERAGALDEQTRALEAWAQRSSGTERGLALVELAAVLVQRDRSAEALPVLRRANASRAPAALLRSVGDALLRTQGDAGLLDSFGTRTSDDALRAAAKLARDPARLAEEREALDRLQTDERAAVTADVLTFDVAAEQGDTTYLGAALARDATRWPSSARIGPLLAALDLTGPEYFAWHDEHWNALRMLANGQPVVTRYMAARAGPGSVGAEWWRAEADAASGEQAAFASTMAGRYLESAGADPTEAYADALDSVRGYAPGALGLEIAARQRADLDALDRVQREIASTTESQFERCARRVRLGLLNAESDLEGATRWLDLAAEDQKNDAVLDELTIRLSMDQSPANLAVRLRDLAALETGPSFARALRLRAAAASEDAGQWDDAIQIYRALLEQTPGDHFTDNALLSALHQAGQFEELSTEYERRLVMSDEPSMRAPLLEDWATAEAARGEAGRTRMVLETLLDRDPQHVPTLRALQRVAMREHDDLRLANLSLALSETLEQPAAASAELRLAVRFEALLGSAASDALLRAEPRAQQLWHALRLEDLALRSGDRSRIYDALRKLSELLRDPIERTAYALRAAEVMENPAPERAMREIGPTLLATPEHPLAIAQLARLQKAAGHARAAAESFERAGFLASATARAVPLFYAAGVLFEDENETERARVNLDRVAQNDILFADTFVRLRCLLRETGRVSEESALLELRLSAAIEPAAAAGLELERSQLAEQLGDRATAKRALRASLEHVVEQPAAWHTLADLHSQDEEYRETAEALVQWARVAGDDQSLADALFQLAVLYEEQLPDPRRAELALTRVASLTPDDPRPLERLVALYQRQDKNPEALRALEQLIEMTGGAAARERFIVRHANLLLDMGQQQAAEHALDEARRLSPASMPVLRSLSRLYELQGDRAALTLHLQRSCHALRAAIEHEPGELSHWLGLCELLLARQRPDGVALVSSMARALGLDHPELSDEVMNGLGTAAMSDSVQRRIMIHGAFDPLRTLLRENSLAIARCLTFDGPAHPSSFDHAAHVVEAVEQLFGISGLQLLGIDQAVCLPIADEPLSVCVGRALWLQAGDPERFFLLARAVAVAKLGCTLLVRSVPERVLLVLHALWSVAEPAHTATVLDAHEQARVLRELLEAIPLADRPRLAGQVAELMGHEDLNPRRLAASAFDYGSRVGLVATGNVNAALHSLLRLRGRPPETFSDEDVFELCRSDAPIRALLSFAISEVYLDARRESSPQFAREHD